MSISEPFIRRPIATSLLMLGVLVFGIGAYGLLPVAALPNVDFPTIVVSVTYPGASPDTMASAVATPLEQQFAAIPVARPDDFDERHRLTVDHPAIRSFAQHRRRGGGRAAGDQRGQRSVAARSAEPADLPQDQPGRSSGTDLRRSLRRAADLSGRRFCLHDPSAKAVDGARRLRGADLRPADLCGACADQSRGVGLARPRV